MDKSKPAPGPPAAARTASAGPDGAPARVVSADLIRVIALAAVIVLHVAAVPVTHYKDLPVERWWWANAYDSLARPCIPLFVMLSGALLLTAREWNPGTFVRRRATKVVIPFVAWSAIYFGWNGVVHDQAIPVARFFRHLAGGMGDPVYPHLWYLPLILSLYVLLPVVRIYTTNSSLKNQSYFIALWLGVTVLRPAIESRWGFPIGFYLDPVFGFIGYFVLGATFWMYAPKRLPAIWLAIAGITFAAGYTVTTIGTYGLTVRAGGELDETYYSNLAPNVILMSVSGFALLRHLGEWLQEKSSDFPRLIRCLTLASAASFGAYLIHMIVLETFGSGVLGFAIGPMSENTSWVVPALSAATLFGGLTLATLMRQVRALRWLVP